MVLAWNLLGDFLLVNEVDVFVMNLCLLAQIFQAQVCRFKNRSVFHSSSVDHF